MKKWLKKRHLLLVLFLIVGLCLFGCGKKSQQEKGLREGQIWLYYLDINQVGFYKVPYDLNEELLPDKEAGLILSQLSSSDDNASELFKYSIPDGVKVKKIMQRDNTLLVDMESEYKQMDPSSELLCRSAIVFSLCQLEAIDYVEMMVDGEPLVGAKGTVIGKMKAEDFMIGEEALHNSHHKVTLYYVDRTKEGEQNLVSYEMKISKKDNQSLEEAALDALAKAPEDKDEWISALPEALKVNELVIENNICYVDLSKAILDHVEGVDEKLTVYAMVNTIVSLGRASSVKFTVEGVQVSSLYSFEGFDQMLTINSEVLKTK